MLDSIHPAIWIFFLFVFSRALIFLFLSFSFFMNTMTLNCSWVGGEA